MIADISQIGETKRVSTEGFAEATVHAVRRQGTATTGVIEFKRANSETAPGVSYGTPATLTLNADNLFSATIDVKNQSHLVIEVTTTAAVQFDLYTYLTPLV